MADRSEGRRPAVLLVCGLATAVVVAVVVLVAVSGINRTVEGIAAPAPALVAQTRMAEDRDAAFDLAERGALAMTTIDHRDRDGDWSRLKAVATDELVATFEEGRDEADAQVRRSKLVVRAEVLTAAVSKIDDDTATALVVIRIRRSTDGQAAQEGIMRLELNLEQAERGWRMSDITEVP